MKARIDAHQHFWNPARGDYGWLSPDLPIYRTYGPADLRPHLRKSGFDGTVLVQAAPTLHETEYLLGEQTPRPSSLAWSAGSISSFPAAARRWSALACIPSSRGCGQ